MIVFKQNRIYREDLKANPDILYIFGDNLDREGLGGQAGEMRGEPNAFGIATKRGIGHGFPDDYFIDGEDDVIPLLTIEFKELNEYIRKNEYKAICIPLDGIGTGLSRMPEYAPKALSFIDKQFADVYKKWNSK